MKHHTETEENYLKSIHRFSKDGEMVGTNTLSNYLKTSPASVTDMLKKLGEKNLVEYKPYHGAKLTDQGHKIALKIIRKHRLWEVFLVDKLNFSWDNVHDVAEQLEHIDSAELINRLDAFLDYPKFDPHGDPIPSESGEIEQRATDKLSKMKGGDTVIIASVLLSSQDFLQYLDRVGLVLNKKVRILETLPFDDSLALEVDGTRVIVSGAVSKNILVLKETA